MNGKRKLKVWQIVLLCLAMVLFVIATIVLCVFYKNAIFTENTFAIVLMCASALMLVAMCVIGWRFFKR